MDERRGTREDPERDPRAETGEDDVEREAPPPERDPEPRRAPREGDVEREREVERERTVERERPVREGDVERERPPPTEEVSGRDAAVWRVMQGVDWLFYLLYGLFLLRFVLAMVGASEASGFVQFVHAATQPFYAPFEGIVGRPAVDGGYLDFPLAIALVAYVLLHIAIKGLIRVVVGPRPAA